MPLSAPAGWIAGYARSFIFFTDSTGAHTGQQSTLANGASSAAYVASNVKTANLQPITPTNLNIQGGDRIVTTFQFGNAKHQGFDLILSDVDVVLMNLISGALSNVVNTQRTVVSENPNLTTPRLLGLALQQRYKQIDGSAYWATRIFPKCEMRYKQGDAVFQAESDTVINVTPALVTKAISAQSFGTGAANLVLGLELDQTDNYVIFSANPIHFMSFRADAAATTFTLPYTPLSSVVTINATPNEMHKNGTATALVSVSTATKLVTLAAAGAAADIHVLNYETNFVP